MNNSLRIFIRFFQRDLYVCKKHLTMYFINFVLLASIVSSFALGYLQATTFFGSDNIASTTMFVGSICLTIFIISYRNIVPLLYDLSGMRFIEYQIILLQPRLVIIERIFFTALFTFLLTVPFYPITKLIMHDKLHTAETSWFLVAAVLLCASLMCSAYNILACCFLKSPYQLNQLWSRFNIPLLIISSFVPWHVFNTAFPKLSYLALFNPMLYVTEGMRQAFLRSSNFLPIGVCLIALLFFAALFTLLAWHYFKKRTDHV